jgi:hypothetical protein
MCVFSGQPIFASIPFLIFRKPYSLMNAGWGKLSSFDVVFFLLSAFFVVFGFFPSGGTIFSILSGAVARAGSVCSSSASGFRSWGIDVFLFLILSSPLLIFSFVAFASKGVVMLSPPL